MQNPSSIRRILVMRPNALGDFVFALPALHALRHAYPQARISYLGLPWHQHFLQDRNGPVDEVVQMPPWPGISLPPDAPADPALLAPLRASRFDLALQCYGGGRYANPFIAALDAGISIGAATADALALDRTLPYARLANRRLELLQLAALAGAAPCLPEREWEATAYEHAKAAALLPAGLKAPIVIVHPGASDPRRRWPPERFAAVADALAARGAAIVLSGGPQEQPLLRQVSQAMRSHPLPLAGPLDLPALCGMLARARLVVANDTGPLHLALALGRPAVGIFWFSNLIESAPLRPALLWPAVATRQDCPRCGADQRQVRCQHEDSFVDEISTEEVRALACEAYARKACA